MIYLDNAATSFPKPPGVAQAVYDGLTVGGGNAGRGGSRAAEAASAVLERLRGQTAGLFHIPEPRQIAFTLNITQALNLALLGFLQPGDHVISTDLEHNALARPLEALRKRGVAWTRVRVADGFDPERFRAAIRPRTRMIAMLHGSNVTGEVFPIAEIGKLCREYGLLFPSIPRRPPGSSRLTPCGTTSTFWLSPGTRGCSARRVPEGFMCARGCIRSR